MRIGLPLELRPLGWIGALATVLTACSGAAPSDVFGAPPNNSSASSATEPADSPSSTSKDDTTKTSPTTEPSPGKETPAAACTNEVENNDSADVATPFEGCAAGSIEGRGDTDYFKIVAPDDANMMRFEHTEAQGKVVYRVMPEGEPYARTTFIDGAQDIEVHGGATYIVRVSFPNNQGNEDARPYEVNVSFE